MMEQGRGDDPQGSRSSHQQSSIREKTPQPDSRGPRREKSDYIRYDDRSRSCDTRRSHSRGTPSHRDYSNRSRSRDLTRSRPREEQEGRKRKRDEDKTFRWDETPREDRESRRHNLLPEAQRDTEKTKRTIRLKNRYSTTNRWHAS